MAWRGVPLKGAYSSKRELEWMDWGLGGLQGQMAWCVYALPWARGRSIQEPVVMCDVHCMLLCPANLNCWV